MTTEWIIVTVLSVWNVWLVAGMVYHAYKENDNTPKDAKN